MTDVFDHARHPIAIGPTVATRRTAPEPDDAVVLEAIGWEPCGLEALMVRTGSAVGELSLALDRLEDAGWIARRGGWTERVGPSVSR